MWLRTRYAWETVAVIGEGRWLLPGDINEKQFDLDPKTIGLPGEPDPSPAPPLAQRLVPGLVADDLQPDPENLTPEGKRKTRSKRPKNYNPARIDQQITPTIQTPF